jgi:2-dehydro-3-deoxyglucarate aldolase
MDAGAHGVIVPMVNSRAEAISAVASVYYPPKGHRGVGLARAQGYGTAFEQYREQLNARSVIIVQVEHIDAVNNLADILSVPGIDGYLIGPYDLSASMNISGQFTHPDMIAAIAKIKRIGSELDKPGGLHIVEPDFIQLEEHIEEGFKFIAYSLDTRMLDTTCRAGLRHLRR